MKGCRSQGMFTIINPLRSKAKSKPHKATGCCQSTKTTFGGLLKPPSFWSRLTPVDIAQAIIDMKYIDTGSQNSRQRNQSASTTLAAAEFVIMDQPQCAVQLLLSPQVADNECTNCTATSFVKGRRSSLNTTFDGAGYCCPKVGNSDLSRLPRISPSQEMKNDE